MNDMRFVSLLKQRADCYVDEKVHNLLYKVGVARTERGVTNHRIEVMLEEWVDRNLQKVAWQGGILI